MKAVEVKRAISHLIALLFFVATSFGVTGCGGSSGSNSNNNNAASQQPSQLDRDWAAVDKAAYINGGPFNMVQIISIDSTTNTLTVAIPLPSNPTGASVSSPIPDLPGATAGLEEDPTSQQWYFTVNVPLSDLVTGVKWGSPATLPNGESLPAVPSGTLPNIASKITVNGTDYSFYLYGSQNYFGIFFPTPWFNPYIQLEYPIMNSAQTAIDGYFVTVPNSSSTSGNDGGMWFAMDFSAPFQQLLTDLVNYGNGS